MGAFSRFSERFHGNKVPGFDKAGPGLWYPVMKVMIGGDICWISHILCWEYIWLGCFGIEFSQPPAMRSSIGPQTLQHVFFSPFCTSFHGKHSRVDHPMKFYYTFFNMFPWTTKRSLLQFADWPGTAGCECLWGCAETWLAHLQRTLARSAGA